MSVRSRSGALTAGLILIVIGLIFFLQNVYDYQAWRLIADYWPIILIIIGLKKIYDFFTWQGESPLPENAPKE